MLWVHSPLLNNRASLISGSFFSHPNVLAFYVSKSFGNVLSSSCSVTTILAMSKMADSL